MGISGFTVHMGSLAMSSGILASWYSFLLQVLSHCVYCRGFNEASGEADLHILFHFLHTFCLLAATPYMGRSKRGNVVIYHSMGSHSLCSGLTPYFLLSRLQPPLPLYYTVPYNILFTIISNNSLRVLRCILTELLE